jgi:predicted nucleic acid-binding protein
VINSLIDAGPIISLFDKDDSYHKILKTYFAQNFKGHLFSTWPVITEVSHLLKFNIQVQIDFYKWIDRGAIQIIDIDSDNFKRIIELSTKYSDIPMDLADASLIVLSEITEIKNIITIDSDYYIYRTNKKKMLNNLVETYIINN